MSAWRRGQRAPEPVLLNVYDLHPINDTTHDFGIGLYHSGIEIHGVEYAFGAAPSSGASGGIYAQPPRTVPNARFRESVSLGSVPLSPQQVRAHIAAMQADPEWSGANYNVVLNNCNRFAEAFARRLGTPHEVPGYVNRLASLGGCLSFLLPKELLMRDPATGHGSGGAGGGGAGGGGGGGAFAGEGHALLNRGGSAGGGGNAGAGPTAAQLQRTDWKCEKCMRFQGTFAAVAAHEQTCDPG